MVAVATVVVATVVPGATRRSRAVAAVERGAPGLARGAAETPVAPCAEGSAQAQRAVWSQLVVPQAQRAVRSQLVVRLARRAVRSQLVVQSLLVAYAASPVHLVPTVAPAAPSP